MHVFSDDTPITSKEILQDSVGKATAVPWPLPSRNLPVLDAWFVEVAPKPSFNAETHRLIKADRVHSGQGDNRVVTQGWIIEEKPVPVASDFVLQPYQFHSILRISGKKTVVQQIIAQFAEPQKTIVEERLERSKIFERDDPLIEQIRVAIGMTVEELDTLWIQAKDF